MSELAFKPGRDFSMIHITLNEAMSPMDQAVEAITIWDMLTEKYPEAVYEEPRARGAEEQGGQDDPARPAGAQPASRGSGTGVWCREHRAELIQSKYAIDKKNEYDSFYHPLAQPAADGQKNCNLWFRQTVDVTGESNEGKPLPSSVKQPPVEAQATRPDDDPGPNEPDF